jgi:dTDP-4-amino-4,6-dideoxygalactose transaminase
MRAEGGPYRDHYGLREVGFRYEMNEIHAAVGLAQLPRLAADNERRHAIAAAYEDELGDVAGLELLLHDAPDRGSAHHMFVVLADERERLAEALDSRGVEVGVHYPVNELLRAEPGELPVMDDLAERVLTLPLHPGLSDDDVATVIAAVREGW